MVMRWSARRLVRGASLCLAAAAAATVNAQLRVSTFPREGITERPVGHTLLTGARVVVEPGRVLDEASIELRNGRIVAVHAGRRAVEGAAVRDMRGKTVYAGFIDMATQVGVPSDMRAGAIKPFGPGQTPLVQTLDQPGARHWNRRVRPEWSVAERLEYVNDEVRPLRGLGFAAALGVPAAGVVRGQAALLSLRDAAQDREVLLASDRAQAFGFDLAGGFSGEYPGSLMGAIALIRQSLLDARWYAGGGPDALRAEANLALRALGPTVRGQQLALFALEDELDVARVAALVREFDLRAVLIGTGHEYRVRDALRTSGLPIVIPLTFPEVPAVEDVDIVSSLSLAELEHWEQAAANAARLVRDGTPVAFTTRGMKEPAQEFLPALRRAVAEGLAPDEALRALTTTPAALLEEESQLGRVAPGYLANLVVADAELFSDKDAKIHEVWVEGDRYELHPLDAPDAGGSWLLSWSDGRDPASITIEAEADALEIAVGERRVKARFESGRLVTLAPADLFGSASGRILFNATIDGDLIEGFVLDDLDRRIRFTGRRTAAAAVAEPETEDVEAIVIRESDGFPAGEYRRLAPPLQPAALLFRGATVWTNTADGVLETADVLVRKGRIARVGRALVPPRGAVVIEAQGRHLTPGIVDAHSHTAIARNVNEPSHAVTTEVRVADVLDPTDIDIYRQLAGGVTTANLLHGSANPMGGQNAVIKLRWGEDAAGLRFTDAPPGIKFALGENVKQSGWGDAFTTRYPQTRMGVEQIMRENFLAAREYLDQRAAGATRRDLRLEALGEILLGRRLVHIHSYRQDEILMFVRLAREFGFDVATFQHVLEGYKVAPEIASLGAGASTFSDWWGFKMEVIDAIPYNAALMTRAGVLSSLNSDSNEMARRLNTEAAKAMRYGGLDPEQALKLVTLNPARQLRLDHRIGAIAPGLDADLVLWSASPLSNYTRAEQTWIEGRRYFDRDEDAAERNRIAAERGRLLARAAQERASKLKLEDVASSPDADAEGESLRDETPALLAQARRDAHWLIHHAARRSPYHSGADLSSCGVNDHAH